MYKDEEKVPLVQRKSITRKNQEPQDSNEQAELESQPRSSINSQSSARTSRMGETVLYEEHLTEADRERKDAHLKWLRLEIILFGLLSLIIIILALCANGFLGQGTTLIATTGCGISLGSWYVFLMTMCFIKFAFCGLRSVMYSKYNEESIVVHLGGNFIIMPCIFFAFFIATQIMNNTWTGSTAYPLIPYSITNPTPADLYLNECQIAGADSLSSFLFTFYQMVSVLSFVGVIYFMVTTFMLFQSVCLLYALINRRITIMTRRDQALENGQDRNI